MTVYDEEGILVQQRTTWGDALDEACRRLKVMHEKWPLTPWRMAIRKDQPSHMGKPNQRWGIYAKFDQVE